MSFPRSPRGLLDLAIWVSCFSLFCSLFFFSSSFSSLTRCSFFLLPSPSIPSFVPVAPRLQEQRRGFTLPSTSSACPSALVMAWFAISAQDAGRFHQDHFVPLVDRTLELQVLALSSGCSSFDTKYELQLKQRSGEYDARQLLAKSSADSSASRNNQTSTLTEKSPGATNVKAGTMNSVRFFVLVSCDILFIILCIIISAHASCVPVQLSSLIQASSVVESEKGWALQQYSQEVISILENLVRFSLRDFPCPLPFLF